MFRFVNNYHYQFKLIYFLYSRLNHFYYAELCKIDSSLKNRPTIKFLSIEDVFEKLKIKFLNVSLLHRMCKDFNWNFQEALVTQVFNYNSVYNAIIY